MLSLETQYLHCHILECKHDSDVHQTEPATTHYHYSFDSYCQAIIKA